MVYDAICSTRSRRIGNAPGTWFFASCKRGPPRRVRHLAFNAYGPASFFVLLIENVGNANHQGNDDTRSPIFSHVARGCNHGPFELWAHVQGCLPRAMMTPCASGARRSHDIFCPINENGSEERPPNLPKL